MDPRQNRNLASKIIAWLDDTRRGVSRSPPSLAELEPLAREYLKLVSPLAGRLLGSVGSYIVTLEAAREFGAVARLDDVIAHRELVVRMYTAKPMSNDPTGWRAVDNEWDISARTSAVTTRSGQLLVITTTNTRPRNRGNFR